MTLSHTTKAQRGYQALFLNMDVHIFTALFFWPFSEMVSLRVPANPVYIDNSNCRNSIGNRDIQVYMGQKFASVFTLQTGSTVAT